MITDDKNTFKLVAGWSLLSWLISHSLALIFPVFFGSLDNQGIDRIQRLLYTLPATRPAYHDAIVHVDLNNDSLLTLRSQHPDRADHAQLVQNLSSMGVAVQMLDFIYAGSTSESADVKLVDAVSNASAVTIGTAIRLVSAVIGPGAIGQPKGLAATQIHLQFSEDESQTGYSSCAEMQFPFDALGSSGAAMGFLTLEPDSDGTFRRLPLLVRCGNGFHPSFALAAVAQYLGVSFDRIAVAPGKIRLRAARFPNEPQGRDMVIPVDKAGHLRIHYVGPWGRMLHYNYSDVYLASRDQDAFEIFKEELDGKIVLFSDVTTGATDVGRTPLDLHFPVSGVHANAVHTILTETFLVDAPWHLTLLLDTSILVGLSAIALRFSPMGFTLATVCLLGTYLCITAGLLHTSGIILAVVRPLLMIFIAMLCFYIAASMAKARMLAKAETARQLAEKDLSIGRSIQSSFLPLHKPRPTGWEVAAHFEPARQVSGDFYDFFELGNGRYLAFIIADVCDKGVGAALFMALTRSLIRAFTIQEFGRQCDIKGVPCGCSDKAVLNAVKQANHYIAETHMDSGMFATLFMGILEVETGQLRYVNCGHEPPLVIDTKLGACWLKPTGPVLGALPESTFAMSEVGIHQGGAILAFTDGLTESESSNGEAFGKARIVGLAKRATDGAQTLLDQIVFSLSSHTSGQAPFDDVTIVVLQRQNLIA